MGHVEWRPITTVQASTCLACAPNACSCYPLRPFTFTPWPQPTAISDADVERIAARAAELVVGKLEAARGRQDDQDRSIRRRVGDLLRRVRGRR